MAWTKTQSGSQGPEVFITLSEEALNDSSKTLLFSDLGSDALHLEILAVRIELTAGKQQPVGLHDAADLPV